MEPMSTEEEIPGFESDDFGDFDDFDEFEQPPQLEQQTPVSSHTEVPQLKFETDIKSQVENLLKKPETEALNPSEDRFTRTAVGLWHKLMEDPSATFVQWDGSSLHRKLVQSFGVPLNLDQALPKVETRKMSFETTNTEMKQVPDWTLLSIVSQQAVDGMDENERQEYDAKLRQAITEASSLLETLECHEMDLQGEKDVLEGMVDSLLAYSQKSQRSQLNKKK